MTYLILGLAIFLGVHSVRIFGDGWRTSMRNQHGENTYKGVYSVLSILGFGLVIWGFGVAREAPVQLWMPPRGMRHAASLLTLISFVLLAGAYVPRNFFKARFHHPMVLAVKVWALAHLLSNGNVAHVLLFGAFLAWAVLSFVAARKRDRLLKTVYVPATTSGTLITVVAGALAWAAFALYLHGMLIGIRPFG